MYSNRTLACLAWAIVLSAACSSFAQAQTWTLLGPPSRHSHSAVWDPTSEQMIIFGGQETSTNTDLNDVWLGKTSTDQDDSFTALVPTGTLPPGRYGHVATYDSVTNHMTIFGGGEGFPSPCANDVWVLENANGRGGSASWLAENPSGTAPLPRIYSAGVYDPTTDSMIVFGGNNCSTGYFDDVWVLSGANGEGTQTWTQLTPSGTPPAARESASAIYDSTHNILTIYAGDAGGSPFGDVWTLSNANGTGGTPTWTQLSPTGTAPEARTGQAATYDSADNRMTIFGGANGSTTLTDSWVLTSPNGLDGTPAWSEIDTQGTAPSVAYFSAVFNQTADDMYVFAGASDESKLSTNDHVFTLEGANGISKLGFKWFLGGPAVRYSTAAFYDSVTNGLFLFGGAHASTLFFNDYWEEVPATSTSNLNWTLLHPAGSVPSPRYGHTGLYDSNSDRMMIFGGATGTSTCVNDYHVLENANDKGGTLTFLSVSPTGTKPAARVWQASAYDPTTNTLMIFGGFNCKSTYFNDVWVLSDASAVSGTPSWTHLTPEGSGPGVREASSAVYNSSTNTLTVYGGDAGGEPFGDIWVLSNANGTGGTPAWTELVPSGSGPVARSGQSAIYDATDNLMTIYAGYNGSGLLDDVWVLSNANGQGGSATWTELPSSGQQRRYPSSVYDSSIDVMVTFGGTTGVEPQNPSSDTYTLTDANGLLSERLP
jgi:hypothetical protein